MLPCLNVISVLNQSLGVRLDDSVSLLGWKHFLKLTARFRHSAEIENNMNAVERLLYYAEEIKQESQSQDHAPPKEWPSRGEIEFKDVELSHRPGLPLALRGISLQVRPGEHIGVVGRSGAGKSSRKSHLEAPRQIFNVLQSWRLCSECLSSVRDQLPSTAWIFHRFHWPICGKNLPVCTEFDTISLFSDLFYSHPSRSVAV